MSRGARQVASRVALRALLVGLAVTAPRDALALGPFEKNHPRVEEGLKAYGEGRYEDALAAFEAAKRELPDNAVVEFDRGNALYKLRRLKEAQEAYRRVAELDRGQLQQKDYYNLGNAFAELGQARDAVAAYRKALLLDPGDDLSRHNMEVVLRNLPPPQPKQPKPQPRDGGSDAGPDRPDGGSDGGGQGGSDGGSPDAGRGDAGNPGGTGDGGTQGDGGHQGGRADPGPDAGNTGGSLNKQQPTKGPPDAGSGASQADDDEMKDEGGQDEELAPAPMPELNKKDVERLLDSMKQSEKNLQLWRFQQRKKSSKSRKDNAKDW